MTDSQPKCVLRWMEKTQKSWLETQFTTMWKLSVAVLSDMADTDNKANNIINCVAQSLNTT